MKNFINDIEKLNKDLLPVLLQELGQVNYDLHLVENKLTKHKPIYDKINKIFSPLVKLKVRISSINDKNPDAYDSLIKLFNDKYHNYDELQDESTKARKKYQNIERSIADLNRYDRGFKRYIEKITNYFES